jgi:hypothetical protein
MEQIMDHFAQLIVARQALRLQSHKYEQNQVGEGSFYWRSMQLDRELQSAVTTMKRKYIALRDEAFAAWKVSGTG